MARNQSSPWDSFKNDPGYQMELSFSKGQKFGRPIDPMNPVKGVFLNWEKRHMETGLQHNCMGPILAPYPSMSTAMVEDGPGWVYYIQDLSNGNIKIGHTGQDPEKRMANLQTGCSGELVLLRKDFVQKMIASEQSQHGRFKGDRIRGEWFLPSSALMDFIRGKHATKKED
jgi:hypothetical protein